MSDYLSRAVDRALPQAQPSLRPRLPSRFESTPAPVSGVTEMNAEIESAPPRVADTGQEAAFPPTRSPTPAQATLAHADAPVFAPLPPPSVAAEQQRSNASRSSISNSAPLLVQHVHVSHAPATAPQGEKFPAPASPTLIHQSVAAEAHDVRPATRKPEESQPLLALPDKALPMLPSMASTPAEPKESIVNISIGRLEIRAATPAPERPRAAASTARAPLSLDDYLRGKKPRRTHS